MILTSVIIIITINNNNNDNNNNNNTSENGNSTSTSPPLEILSLGSQLALGYLPQQTSFPLSVVIHINGYTIVAEATCPPASMTTQFEYSDYDNYPC